MITSKLTNKFRTTIPRPVRTALDLHPGDEIKYEIGDTGRVVMTHAKSSDEPPASPTEQGIPAASWDDFFSAPGTDLPERDGG